MFTTTTRAVLLGAATTTLTGAAAWWLLRTAAGWWPGTGPVRPESGIAFLAAGVAGLLTVWAAAVLGAATASVWRSGDGRLVDGRVAGRAADRRTGRRQGRGSTPVDHAYAPGLTGRVAAGLLVVAGLGVGAPATASELHAPVAATAQAGSATDLPTCGTGDGTTAERAGLEDRAATAELPSPGWTPTVAASGAARRAVTDVGLVSTAPAATSAPEVEEVVVRRGDTLWDISARHLGPRSTAQDVAEAWPRWYAANREMIGDDPDLIQPGQRLVVPPAGGSR